MDKKIRLPLIILSVFVLLLLVGLSAKPKTIAENSVETLTYPNNPHSIDQRNEFAITQGINEEDTPYSCSIPKDTGINECLMNLYQTHYGKSYYQGIKSTLLNELLVSFAKKEMSKEQIVSQIENQPAWDEVIPYLYQNQTPIQVSIANVEVGTFKTDSHLVNEIWAEMSNKQLVFDTDYHEVVITFDKEEGKNTISILAVNFNYIEVL